MVTYARANWQDKVKFIFHLFDFDNSGGISDDEMIILSGCFIRGLCTMSQSKSPSMAQLKYATNIMFQEADRYPDNNITIDELNYWVEHNPKIVQFLLDYEPIHRID